MSEEQRATIDAQLRAAGFDAGQSPAQLRTAFEELMANAAPPAGVTVSDTTLGGRPALAVDPQGAATDGTILYFHGGSWVFGSLDEADAALDRAGRFILDHLAPAQQ